MVTSAPPELPGLIAASVWMKKPIIADADLGARQRRDDAAGDGLADAEGIADRQHQIAHLERVGIAERQSRQASRRWCRSSAPARSVRSSASRTVAVNSRLSVSTTVISVAVLDHVIVGDDQAVGAHDDAGAQRVLHPLLRHAEAEIVAEELLEERDR